MLKDFPAESRVWFFPLSSPLEEKAGAFSSALSEFIGNWLAHGKGVRGSFEVVYDQLVVVGADPEITEVSGCSIDSLFRAVAEIAEAHGNAVVSNSQVLFLAGETVRAVARSQFRDLLASGSINQETTVFDNTVQTLAEINAGRWQLPLKDSWHAKL